MPGSVLVMAGFSYERAIRAQRILGSRVLSEAPFFPRVERVRLAAGVDAAYWRGVQVASAVLVDCESGFLQAYTCQSSKPSIPYIPGLLAFREAPVYLKALGKLPVQPDVVLVDGHGLSHPRALGIATHIGLVLGKPTIGVAKKPLYGREEVVEGRRIIVAHGMPVGEVIETPSGSRLYVSIGYKIKLEDAVRIVRSLLRENIKLPLPLHLADTYSKNKCMKELRIKP
ncbi:MAG: endonuclease V [Desulfurococcus sp.]|nr:endonuclease V [Desulfurococcus sp.]